LFFIHKKAPFCHSLRQKGAFYVRKIQFISVNV
jgi:hypothetical protein